MGLRSRPETPGARNHRIKAQSVVWKEMAQALDGPSFGPTALHHEREHVQEGQSTFSKHEVLSCTHLKGPRAPLLMARSFQSHGFPVLTIFP